MHDLNEPAFLHTLDSTWYLPTMQSDDFDNVGYLLGDTARVLRNRFDQYAKAKGITRPQWLLLIALMRQEPVNQVTMAAYLDVEAISLSRMVNRLQKAGLVERRTDQKDQRVKMLYLTPTSNKLLLELRRCGAQVIEEASDGMSAADIVWFSSTLEKFRANLVKVQAGNV